MMGWSCLGLFVFSALIKQGELVLHKARTNRAQQKRSFASCLTDRLPVRLGFYQTILATICLIGSLLLVSTTTTPSEGAVAPASSGHVTALKDKLLDEGLAYYSGKTITIISPAAAATSFDDIARSMAAPLEAYLHVTVEVTDISGAATIIGQNTFDHAAPNGLTLGVISPLLDTEIQLSGTPGLNFNPERLAFLDMLKATPSVFVTDKGSGCPLTFAGLLAASKTSNPTSFINPSAGVNALGEDVLNSAFALNGRMVYGFSTTPLQVTGLVDDDACITELPLGNAGPLIQQGVAVPLAYVGTIVKGLAYSNSLAGVPSVAKLIKEYASKYKTRAEKAAQKAIIAFSPVGGNVLVAQTSTDSAELTALRAAVVYMNKLPSFQDAMLNLGVIPTEYKGSAKGAFVTATKDTAPIADLLKS
jgi:hypothetical protein